MPDEPETIGRFPDVRAHGDREIPRPPFRPVAVFRALQLGDLLCAVPALRALKQAHPEHCLTLVGLPWAEQLLERYPAYLDDFIAFPGWPGIAEREPDAGRAQEYEWQAAHRQFDLAVQMHGDGSFTNAFVDATPARSRAGFAPDEESCLTGFIPYPTELSEVDRLLRLAAHITAQVGAEDLDPTLEFPVFEDERVEASGLLSALGRRPDVPYVCMHPGGRGADRRWPAARFATIADGVVAAGSQVVLTGSEIDRAVNEEVRALVHTETTGGNIVDLTGRTTIGTLGAVIERAALVVTNDSAPSHLAAAVRVPSVVIFTGSDRRRWAPADGNLHRAVGAGRPDGGPPGTPGTPPEVEEVLAAVHAGLTTLPRWASPRWTAGTRARRPSGIPG